MKEQSLGVRIAALWAAWLPLVLLGGFAHSAHSQVVSAPGGSTASRRETPMAWPLLDRSGRKRVGEASFYADMFTGRKMADGSPMNPDANNAASKTLPLGTTAMVTNLRTGAKAVITIQDRGPFVKGRIVDLSPSTAREIGIAREDGVAQVEVAPIKLPPLKDVGGRGRSPPHPRVADEGAAAGDSPGR